MKNYTEVLTISGSNIIVHLLLLAADLYHDMMLVQCTY